MREYIDIINENDQNNQQQLNESGGAIDKTLAALGGRAAKGRVALKRYYNDLVGDWREYASEIGLDRGRLFSQNEFPSDEFVDFLKTQQDFDDEMIQSIKGLDKKRADVEQVMRSAAEAYAKKVRGARLKRRKEEPQDQDMEQAAKAMADDTAKGSDADQASTYFNAIGGDLEKATKTANAVIGNPARMKKLDQLQRVGIAYLAARGKLKVKK